MANTWSSVGSPCLALREEDITGHPHQKHQTMIIVNTKDLIGPALDWAIASIEGTQWMWEDLSQPCPELLIASLMWLKRQWLRGLLSFFVHSFTVRS